MPGDCDHLGMRRSFCRRSGIAHSELPSEFGASHDHRDPVDRCCTALESLSVGDADPEHGHVVPSPNQRRLNFLTIGAAVDDCLDPFVR